MHRHLVAISFFLAFHVLGGVAQAQDVINLDVRYGVGVSAYNRLNDSALAPHYAHLSASYLFLEAGPIQMGPALAYRLGFNNRDLQVRWEGEDLGEHPTLDLQHSLRPAWVVYGRPNVHFAWSAWGGVAFAFGQPDVKGVEEEVLLDAEISEQFIPQPESYFVWGLEVGGSASYFLTAGFALTLGAQYSFFYGIDPVHVISFDLGLTFSFEVL